MKNAEFTTMPEKTRAILFPGDLRDWFAGAIPLTQSELDLILCQNGPPEQNVEEALLRYQKADAMLAVRNRRAQ